MDLCGERRTATAGARRIGVFDDELRALEAFGVVDLGADEILVAHRVDEQHYPVFLHHRVVVALHFVESKAVLKPGAAATRDKHAQLQFGVAFLVNQLLDFVRRAVSENKRGGHLCDSIHISTPVTACFIIGSAPDTVNLTSHLDGAAAPVFKPEVIAAVIPLVCSSRASTPRSLLRPSGAPDAPRLWRRDASPGCCNAHLL